MNGNLNATVYTGRQDQYTRRTKFEQINFSIWMVAEYFNFLFLDWHQFDQSTQSWPGQHRGFLWQHAQFHLIHFCVGFICSEQRFATRSTDNLEYMKYSPRNRQTLALRENRTKGLDSRYLNVVIGSHCRNYEIARLSGRTNSVESRTWQGTAIFLLNLTDIPDF